MREATLHAYRRRLPPDAVVSHWDAPDGWRHRRFDWAGDGRGRLLFQTGRADVFEKYLETIAHLHDSGWSVTAFDWRGQGGSGRLSTDPYVGHAVDLDLYIADLAAFWRDWRGEGAGCHVAFGHSMGGHIVLRALVEGAIDPQAVILASPMLGLRVPFGAALGQRLARFMACRGDPARPAWKGEAGRQARLTHDAARYDDEHWWYTQTPALRVGPPSWAWLAEAFRSTAALAADPRLDAVDTPVLMLVADADRLVDARASHRIAARLRDVDLVRFGPEAAHELLRESDAVRDRALAAIDRFLDAKAPA